MQKMIKILANTIISVFKQLLAYQSSKPDLHAFLLSQRISHPLAHET